MRFIHTADWHLGRIMFGEHLTDDQAHVLEQIIRIAKEARADAVIVSGDVYDRPVPPAEAIDLLDDFVSRVVLESHAHIIVIAGNHDSAARLKFASRLLTKQKLHFIGPVSAAGVIALDDRDGPVQFLAVPYAEPVLVKEHLGAESVPDHETAMRLMIDSVDCDTRGRSVLISHSYVGGCECAESERPLSIGGADRINVNCLNGFSYVALGHLHKCQSAGGHIRYSGSVLKYSFSEADHVKAVNLVEIDGAGKCHIETIPLVPKRDVRIITGPIDDLLANPTDGRDDFIQAVLLDPGAVYDAIGRLRLVYPNILEIKRPAPATRSDEPEIDHRKLNDLDLFTAFYKYAAGVEADDDEIAAYEEVVSSLRETGDQSEAPDMTNVR
jgi:DNA repair protein SbcD/Mre11